MLKLLSFPGLLLVGALTFMAAPSNQVAASDCGASDGPECSRTESGLNVLFFRACTTKTSYYILL